DPKKAVHTRARGPATRIKEHKALFIMLAVVVPLTLVPLYGVLVPPTVDLIEHIMISKLLWEKLAGVSHLDIEISWFLGYRLIPIIAVSLIALFKQLGVSLVYLPSTILWGLAAFHAAVVVAIL